MIKKGYIRGGIGKNGQGIGVPIIPKMKPPRTCLGYDVETPGFDNIKRVLFVVGSVYIEFVE